MKRKINDNKSLPYILINPTSHEDWLNERKKGIGASECGKIMGVSNYGTPLGFFLDKLGLSEPVKENWAMENGHIQEPHVAKKFQEETGFNVMGLNFYGNDKKDWIACSREHSFLRVSPDFLYWLKDENGKDLPHNSTNRGVLEVKTSNKHFTPECLANECKSWYCQVQYQMYILGLKHAYLAFRCIAVDGGEYWFQYIPYNAEYTEGVMIPSLIEFWNNHIIPAMADMDNAMNYAPPITTADDVAKKFPTETLGKAIKATEDNDFYDRLSVYLRNREVIKSLESQQKEFEDYVKMTMEDAESILGTDDKAVVTYKAARSSMKFDAAKFKADCPDLYEKYCKETPGTRRLIIK